MQKRVVVWLCIVIAVLALSSCGEREVEVRGQRSGASVAESTLHQDPDRGFSVRFPVTWHRATEAMSRLTDPREVVSLGTMAMSWRSTDCEAFAGAAGESMSARDVVLTVWERGYEERARWKDFLPRPERFGPVAEAEPAGDGCGEPPGTLIHWRDFTDAGRHFHTLVRIGPDVPAGAVDEAWRILDSLRFDADYRPDWPSSG